MGKKNQFVKAVSISTALLLNNATLALAQNSADSSSNDNQTSDTINMISNLKLEKNKASTSAAKLPSTISVDEKYGQLSHFSPDRFSSAKVARSGDSTEDIIKPAQQPISNP